MKRARTLMWGGGIAAGVLLIILGAVWIYAGLNARGEVHDTITQEQITGTPDMKPSAIDSEFVTQVPDCDVADKPIDSSSRARCFAEYMRVHALEASGGKTYSQLARYVDAQGNPVASEEQAAKNPATGRPMENPVRQTWISQRALATGLELAYVGDQVALFSVATGVVFLLVGIGFLVLILAGGVLGSPRAKDDPGPPSAG